MVRLRKSLKLFPWPRLTQTTKKQQWLTSNYDFIRLDDKQLRTISNNI